MSVSLLWFFPPSISRNSSIVETCFSCILLIILLLRMFSPCWDVSSILIRLGSLGVVAHDSFSMSIHRLIDISTSTHTQG